MWIRADLLDSLGKPKALVTASRVSMRLRILFRDDTNLWFPIPPLVTAYARRRDAVISQFLKGSWRIAVALMVMAAEIDVSLSVCTFEELTSVSSLDDGLLSIKM